MYACTHLANSASLLLPVSNLTNLLAFAASGLAFGRFAALMALPWLAAIAVEYVVFGRFFAADLNAAGPGASPAAAAALPVVTLVVVALTLAGFARASAVGVNPAWAAFAGAAVLAVRALARRRRPPPALVAGRRRALPAVRAGPGHRGRGGDRQRARPARWRRCCPAGRRCPRCWRPRRWPPRWPT